MRVLSAVLVFAGFLDAPIWAAGTPTAAPQATATAVVTATETPSITATPIATEKASPSVPRTQAEGQEMGTDVLDVVPAQSPVSLSSGVGQEMPTEIPTPIVRKKGHRHHHAPAVPTETPTETVETPTPVFTPTATPTSIPYTGPTKLTVIPNPASGDKLFFRVMVEKASKVQIRLYDNTMTPTDNLSASGEGLFDIILKLKDVPEGLYYYQARIEDEATGNVTLMPLQKFAVLKGDGPDGEE